MSIKKKINQAIQDYLAGVRGSDEVLFATLRPLLIDHARRLIAQDDVEDVVQDSLTAILLNLAKRKAFNGNGLAYARQVVRNRCIEIYISRAKRGERIDQAKVESAPGNFIDPLTELELKEKRVLLGRGLMQLERPCRKILIRSILHRRPLEELMEDYRVRSVQALYYRRKKCLAKLKKILKKLGGDS